MSVTLHTSCGDLKIELFCDKCPKATENFLALCASGYYDGTIFHRNSPGFLVQGGDPTGTGKGGQSIWGRSFEDEFSDDLLHDKRGIVAMANRGANTNNSQFYITYAPQVHLNNVSTVFGHVISGMDTLNKMEKVPTKGKREKPTEDITIHKVTIHANPIAPLI